MARQTNYLLPEDSDEVLSMPDIQKEIAKEIASLSLSIIEDVKEVINVGINYDTIEYIEDEIEIQVPINYELGLKRDELFKAINASIKNKNDYEFFLLFTVIGYDSTTGKAQVKFNLPVETTFNFADKTLVKNIIKRK